MFKKNLLFLASLLSFCLVHAEIKELATMQDLCPSLPEISEDTKLLFAFDIDDTIGKTEQAFGSNAWFYREFEKELSKPGANRELVVKKMITLYSHAQMYLPLVAVEETTPLLIFALQMLGIPCMGLTARSLDTWVSTPITLVERTIQQLEELAIDFSTTALSENDLELSDNPEKPSHYTRGIIFNGQNSKGEMLLKYLDAVNYRPDLVVYVDDSARHVKTVHDALQAAGIQCLAFRYSAMDEVNKNFDDAAAQQQLEAFLVEHPLVATAA